MLNMKVLDYRIGSNSNQVTVSKVRRDEKGTVIQNAEGVEVTADVGYYPSLDIALRGIQKHYTLSEGTDIQTIKDYAKALSEVQEAFRIELGLEKSK